jgi:protein O-mannosyl-transferase
MGNRKLYLVCGLILFIVVVAVYSNHFGNGFHFDDTHTIVNNIYIRDLGNIPLFFKDGSTFSSLPSNQTYRPLLSASLALDYRLGGGDVFFFHLSTFILFLAQGFLMFLLYRRIFGFHPAGSYAAMAAFFSVAWYMLHPANAETINYIIARSDSITALLVVASFVIYIFSGSGRKWHLYLIPMSLGILVKPSACMFAPLLFVYALFFEENVSLTEALKKGSRPKLVSALKKSAPAFLVAAALFLLVRLMEPATWSPGGQSWFNYVITQPYVALHYFITFFLPFNLSADTDLRALPGVMDGRFITGALFVAAALFAAVIASRDQKTRPVSFGILWFFICLVPTSLIPLAEVMNDHRTFMPYIGLAMAVCWSGYIMVEKYRSLFLSGRIYYGAITAVSIIILSAYAYGTHERNKVWLNEETLWLDVSEKSPKNGRGLMNYGLALMSRGDFAGAETQFRKALEFTPKYSYLHVNMAIVRDAVGATAEAETFFRNAISLGPGYPECYFFYARFLKKHGRSGEAVANLQKALELAPGHMDARYMLMSLYSETRDPVRLQEQAEEVLRISPGDRQAAQYLAALKEGKLQPGAAAASGAGKTPEQLLDLSLKYYQEKQFRKSIEAASKALKLRPGYSAAYNNICAAYNELKQWDKAIAAGEKAVKFDPGSQLAKNNLLWAKKQKLLEKSGPQPPG